MKEMRPGCWRMAVQFGFMNSLEIVPVLGSFHQLEPQALLRGEFGMAFWRDNLFAVLARNAADMTDFLSIPTNRVIELGTLVEL